MIVFIGPYAPIERTESPHLGAAKKIECVIAALRELDEVIFVNTAHNENDKPSSGEVVIIGGKDVVEIVPEKFKVRSLGKLVNLLQVKGVVENIKTITKKVDLVWCYNAYAMENLLRKALKKEYPTAKFILEFEDGIFARSRGLNPKPYIDYFTWLFTKHILDFSFVVNDNLGSATGLEKGRLFPLPGMVDSNLISASQSRAPFSCGQVKVGYFGGLSKEKGADLLLGAAKSLSGVKFITSGSGPLECSFQDLSKDCDCFEFNGRVSDARLVELIAQCDVIINPHSPIERMGGGVFPFKVVEAIASARLVVSTPLPPSEEVKSDSVVIFDGSVEHLSQVIMQAKELYEKNSSLIDMESCFVRDVYSVKGLSNKVSGIIGSEY